MSNAKLKPHTCLNCNKHFTGTYCNHCGQKLFSEHDKKVSHLLNDAFHFITHFDNKFFRACKLIFIKPGLVSREFTLGKKKAYYSPFSLFLVAVFLYLLFPRMQGMNISFQNHLNNNAAIGLQIQKSWAGRKAAAKSISISELGEKFDKISPKISKVLLIILVPLTAFAASLLFRRKKKFFYDHLMYAAEFLSFYIFCIYFLLPLLFDVLNLVFPLGEFGDGNPWFLIMELMIVITVVVAGIKRFYDLKLGSALLFSIPFLLLFLVMLMFVYRVILFAIVMLFI